MNLSVFLLFQIMVRALAGENLLTNLTSGYTIMRHYSEPKTLALDLWLWVSAPVPIHLLESTVKTVLSGSSQSRVHTATPW
jgi:hypothetical protein